MKSQYHATATFCCTKCNQKANVISNHEFVRSYSKEVCPFCKQNSLEKYNLDIVLVKNNASEEPPLEWGYLDKKYANCNNCNPMDAMHWTSLLIKCKNCNTYTMKFKRQLIESKEGNVMLFNKKRFH